jgi:hypothetical protein
MSRGGHHPKHGINPEAERLAHWLNATVAGFLSGEPCPYPRHRGVDWRLSAGGPVVCGVCHPPADGLSVEPVR